MGLFSSFKNMVTGGGAEVTIDVGEAIVGKPVKVSVNVNIKDSEIKSNKVYLNIRCEKKNTDFVIGYVDTNNDGQPDKLTVSKEQNSKVVYNEEIILETEKVYSANSNQKISKEINLPAISEASKEGLVTWKLFAGIDTRGNDPDSGWVTFVVKH